MLDVLLKEEIVDKKPGYAFALGILFATIGLATAVLIFRESPSFPAVFLTALASAPVAMRVTRKHGTGKSIFEKYASMIKIYSYLFFGMAMAFAIWFAILPGQFSALLFKEQLLKFTVGYFTFQGSGFMRIILNNIGLMIFFFLMSLFYGAGSMFLLAWNASILGTMWGNTIKGTLSLVTPGTAVVNTIAAFPYLMPEVAAYFLAAIAGGILSVNIAKKKTFNVSMKESGELLTLAVVLLILAGVIETIILNI